VPSAHHAHDPLWFKDAIFYELHARSFFDASGDGKGDFAGMAQKMEYVRNLGIDCIWVQPMYPSPLLDDGYDISDFCAIHPDFGTLEDFKWLVDEAHRHELRVIIDLVMNHCSSAHPWFQEARADRTSPKRDYFVWTDDPSLYDEARIIFIDTEASNWTFDEVAGQWYWHRFYSHQPDLNYDNPAVWDEMFRIVRFWLEFGIDGFRCDAIPYLYERPGTGCENLPETHGFLQALRAMIDREYPGRILLAEANQWPRDVVPYFGTPDAPEFHMGFHFPVMPRIYLSAKREEPSAIVDIIRDTPPIPDGCQWCVFLRNHDELTLEMVTEEERHEMWDSYTRTPRDRSNLGIRRRLASLLDNDQQLIRMLNALMFSLPGSPIIYYGDEIGMGDNVWLHDRNGVRTPMQWTGEANAGFSTASPDHLYLPLIDDEVFTYRHVNVAAQEREPTSLLNWTRSMLALRKQHKLFGRGSFAFCAPSNPHVLAFERAHEGERLVCLFNFSRHAQAVELPGMMAPSSDLVSGRSVPLGDAILFEPHGFRWLMVEADGADPA
jgi:maltose alpha-D-glucosyltransferase/alpha-amylase